MMSKLTHIAKQFNHLNLFWRTFLLVATMLAGCLGLWWYTLRTFEIEPRTLQTANQVASLVNLTRSALAHSDPITRLSLIKDLADQENLNIGPREPSDTYLPYDQDVVSRHVSRELERRLGGGTITARSVNGQEGLWVGFRLGDDMFWLQLNPDRLSSVSGSTWLAWAGIAALLSLAGAAALARWLNRPLQQLLKAMLRLSQGQFDAAVLNEHVATLEIRQLNQSFNQMAGQLSRAEQDRALMLAGISHDLRTPLARLRLEAEMSVSDATARQYMAADIEQMDGMIGKFLDYARPHAAPLQPVNACQLIRHTQQQLAGLDDVLIELQLPTTDVWVQADAIDLQRIMDNLIENARRYGKTEGTAVAHVLVRCQWGETHASIEVIDQGPGVDANVLQNMTQPFFRADTARSQAQGAGLGLAMVERMIGRMQGQLVLQSPAPMMGTAHAANLPKPCGLWVRVELPVQKRVAI